MSGIVGTNAGRSSGKVGSSAVGADSITGAEIADDVIDSEHYAAGSIDNEHLSDNAVGLAEMAGGTDGNIISYDASGNPVAIATGNDGMVLTSTGAGSPPAFEAAAAGGKVLQIVQSVVRVRAQTTSTSYTTTGLTLNITPSATSSKVLVSVHTCVGLGTNGMQRIHLKIVGTTTSSLGDASSETTGLTSTICVSPRSADANYAQIPASMQLLDSSNSSSQVTYALHWKTAGDPANMNTPHTSDGNDSVGISTITAIEIGA
jgi:hypothetical protein|tara:strand:+ start:397 stop:1179 length:783 start_codon:yes stop_codon:yes gene_type:complete